jgi:TnpA family transposase
MIEGVVHHCTEMEVDRQYVDSHGQSTIAFSFCRSLGFQLMPRLKAIPVQKLSRPDAGRADASPNLQAILTKPIDWELIGQQYDQLVKYATAVRIGTAETEAILRRFVRSNIQHPTYKAFAELGVDDRSGVTYQEYRCVYGEDVESALKFLFTAMAPKASEGGSISGHPFHPLSRQWPGRKVGGV